MHARWARWALRFLPSILVFVAVATWSGRARAYPWMIRHEYTGCTQCHADPSGGGLLTPYGRAQGEVLLRSQFTKRAEDEEPSKVKDFLWGLVPLPEETLLLGGDVRNAYLLTWIGGQSDHRLLQMQADLEGQITIDRFRANASVGYVHEGAQAAQVTPWIKDNVVSRVHWFGVDLGEDKQWLLRAGRMNLPFGVRQIEHTMFVRAMTRTDINDAQQHGVSIAYNGEGLRGELMAIAGNYQINPDGLRERGYTGYLEWAPSIRLALGVSSMITAGAHPNPLLPWEAHLGGGLIRHAHGLFARAVPWGPLVLLAEADLLIASQPADVTPSGQSNTNAGWAGMLQGDLEPWQGLHVIATVEGKHDPSYQAGTSYGGWLGVAWFFAPHIDMRIDGIQQSLAFGPQHTNATSLLAQLHFYL